MDRETNGNYRWYILALAALTNTVTVAIPSMCLSVLFKEIANELNLSLVQVGLIWGISSLPGIVTVFLGGVIADRFGPKRILVISCLLAGLFGALRGVAVDFYTFLVAVFFLGFITPGITMTNLKTCGMWFSRDQLGLASGVLSMGMALGFMIGSLVSATVLSPLLGGWRNVLICYGVIAMAFSIPWFFSKGRPDSQNLRNEKNAALSIREALSATVRIRNVWLMGLAILGFGGCVQGMLGYLPLYLRGQNWTSASADAALASFHTISLLCVVPIALLSDRIRSRKKVLLVSVGLMMVGVGFLTIADGAIVWAAILCAGMVRDGFMAVFMTMIIETDGVGLRLAGSATGFALIFSGISNLISPPIGNSLAAISPGLPFLFWAGLTLFGFIGLFLAKEKSMPVLKLAIE